MVRLGAGIQSNAQKAIRHFNSTMVRLGVPLHFNSFNGKAKFQFHYGTIGGHCVLQGYH